MRNITPRDLTDLLRIEKYEQVVRGYSGVEVYYLPNIEAYLKVGAVAKNSDLRRERDVVEWLAGKLSVPKVLAFELAAGAESILLSEIAGLPASDYLIRNAAASSVTDFLERAAQAMRRMHEIPLVDCSFDQRLSAKFAKAWENIQNGFVDESDFDAERIGKTAEQIYRELTAERPDGEDLVFTHGDLCLPNIIVQNGEIAGFLDLDRGGIADRYQDIALFLRSFKINSPVSLDFENVFCSAYGIESLDSNKLDFYRKLDELF
jgi:aminoglycoside phosphotransferase